MNGVIYVLRNELTKNFYIGKTSTRSLKNRRESHFKVGVNRFLRYDLLKYGPAAFSFEIIEFCDLDKVSERESFWITAVRPTYNILIRNRKIASRYKYLQDIDTVLGDDAIYRAD